MKLSHKLIERGFIEPEVKISSFRDIHHEFMKAYGWIPLSEFNEIPIPTLFSLMEKVSEDKKNKYTLPIPVIILGVAKNGH